MAVTTEGHRLHFGPVIVANDITELTAPLADMLAAEDPVIEHPRRGEYVTPVLAAAGVSSWSKFTKGLHGWLIREGKEPNCYSVFDAPPGKPDTQWPDLTNVSPREAAAQIIRGIAESLSANAKPR